MTSVAGGAEAIDISQSQDVFGIERDYLDAAYFIGHGFIIYLLFEVLANENAFKTLENWSLTEGLAEFYLKKIMGDTRLFEKHQKDVDKRRGRGDCLRDNNRSADYGLSERKERFV